MASGPPIAGVVLTPGAGAARDHSALVTIDRTLAPEGLAVERIDFPYRLAGRRAPDRPPVLIATVVDAVRSLAERLGVPTEQVALGGRSLGGRMCSMAVAEGLPVAALILISYPLHPPRKPDQSRTAHFPMIEVPSLFVSGTRDAFATPEELETATRIIPAPVAHVWLEGGDHGLRRHEDETASAVLDWLTRTSARGRKKRAQPGYAGRSR